MVSEGQIAVVCFPTIVTAHEAIELTECLTDHQFSATQGPMKKKNQLEKTVGGSF